MPRWATVLDPGWHPDDATEFNGAVWPCLGSALWALRTTGSYERLTDGGDRSWAATRTRSPRSPAALAGAVYGFDAIPGPLDPTPSSELPGYGDRVRDDPNWPGSPNC